MAISTAPSTRAAHDPAAAFVNVDNCPRIWRVGGTPRGDGRQLLPVGGPSWKTAAKHPRTFLAADHVCPRFGDCYESGGRTPYPMNWIVLQPGDKVWFPEPGTCWPMR